MSCRSVADGDPMASARAPATGTGGRRSMTADSEPGNGGPPGPEGALAGGGPAAPVAGRQPPPRNGSPFRARRPGPAAFGPRLGWRWVRSQIFTVVPIIPGCLPEPEQPGGGPDDPPAPRMDVAFRSRGRRLPLGRRRPRLGGRADLRGEQHRR